MPIVGAIMVPHPPIILPEVGRGEEKKIADTTEAYEKAVAFLADLKPDTIVLASPHSVMYSDYFHISPGRRAKGDMGQFRASQVKFEVEYDEELVAEIAHLADQAGFPAGTLGEKEKALDHGTMVPLYFINQKITQYQLVRIGLSGLSFQDHYRLGQIIQKACEKLDRRVAFVASGDLSHKLLAEGPYGFVQEGPEYDERIMDVMGRAAFGELFDFQEEFCDKAAECGHGSFCMMAGALDGMDVQAQKLSHEGTFGVGYGICTYLPLSERNPDREFLRLAKERRLSELQAKREKEDVYVKLARETIELYAREGRKMDLPKDLPRELLDREAGVFVSIHKEGRLRGCIGTISPSYGCIGIEIIENAISASTRDPRFDPVRPSELDLLEINVDVLSEAEDISSKEELDVKKYGVIVSKGYKRGLLLPNLDGIDTVEEQLSIALRKAGLSPEEKNYQMQRFEVVRHV